MTKQIRAITCGGEPTENDLRELAAFSDFLQAHQDAIAAGYKEPEAVKMACLDVYGDEFGEGSLR